MKETPVNAKEDVWSAINVTSLLLPCAIVATNFSYFILQMAFGNTSSQTTVRLQHHTRKGSCTLKRMLKVQTPSDRDLRVKKARVTRALTKLIVCSEAVVVNVVDLL